MRLDTAAKERRLPATERLRALPATSNSSLVLQRQRRVFCRDFDAALSLWKADVKMVWFREKITSIVNAQNPMFGFVTLSNVSNVWFREKIKEIGSVLLAINRQRFSIVKKENH